MSKSVKLRRILRRGTVPAPTVNIAQSRAGILEQKIPMIPNNTYIACIAKDEDKYIDEWIEYHLSIGVSKIFIMESEDWYYDLSKYGNKVVVYHNTDMPFEYNDHLENQKAFYSFILNKVKNEKNCHYLTCVDIDEFICFKSKDFGKTIT